MVNGWPEAGRCHPRTTVCVHHCHCLFRSRRRCERAELIILNQSVWVLQTAAVTSHRAPLSKHSTPLWQKQQVKVQAAGSYLIGHSHIRNPCPGVYLGTGYGYGSYGGIWRDIQRDIYSGIQSGQRTARYSGSGMDGGDTGHAAGYSGTGDTTKIHSRARVLHARVQRATIPVSIFSPYAVCSLQNTL